MKQASRNVTLTAAAGYTIRKKKYKGAEHIIVPVVGLVEGVVHAMNAENPELVSAEEFSRAPGGWNGRPIYYGHPVVNDSPVSGNSPALLEDACIGTVFNTAIRKGKLAMEAWINVAKAEEVCPELLERLRTCQAVEISVGVFTDTTEDEGTFLGKDYVGEWKNLVPDHLALLPAGHEGACSNDMGCGVRAAQEKNMDPNMYAEWLEAGPETDALLKTLRNIPQSERDKMPEGDFAGPNRSFPIAEPEDVSAAAHSLGRAKGNRNEIKRKIIAIAYRKGDSFVAQLPEDWKRKADQKAAQSFLQRLLAKLRTAQSPDEMSDNDLRRKLYEALREVEPNLIDVEAWFPVNDPAHVVYNVWIPSTEYGVEVGMGYQFFKYERAFDLSDSGVVTLNTNRIEVESVTNYEPVEGAQPTAAETKNAATGGPCSCKHGDSPTTAEENDMTKTERVKALIAKSKVFTAADQAMLEAASDESLTRYEAATVVPAAQPTEAEVRAAGEARSKEIKDAVDAAFANVSFDTLVAKADPTVRDMVESGRALGQAKKESTIEALKKTGRCKYSDDELKAMSQKQLDILVELAGSNVRAAIDFGGQAAPKDTQASTEQAPEAPPSMDEAIRTARKTK